MRMIRVVPINFLIGVLAFDTIIIVLNRDYMSIIGMHLIQCANNNNLIRILSSIVGYLK